MPTAPTCNQIDLCQRIFLSMGTLTLQGIFELGNRGMKLHTLTATGLFGASKVLKTT